MFGKNRNLHFIASENKFFHSFIILIRDCATLNKHPVLYKKNIYIFLVLFYFLFYGLDMHAHTHLQS
jgi:hypothetical protein